MSATHRHERSERVAGIHAEIEPAEEEQLRSRVEFQQFGPRAEALARVDVDTLDVRPRQPTPPGVPVDGDDAVGIGAEAFPGDEIAYRIPGHGDDRKDANEPRKRFRRKWGDRDEHRDDGELGDNHPRGDPKADPVDRPGATVRGRRIGGLVGKAGTADAHAIQNGMPRANRARTDLEHSGDLAAGNAVSGWAA